MIAVLFELEPAEGQAAAYLGRAADLASLLGGIDGFVSVERFESLARPGRLLSLSFWRDEAAIAAWRQSAPHRDAQGAGRQRIFRDYRLRVCSVIRDYGMNDRARAPADSRAVHG